MPVQKHATNPPQSQSAGMPDLRNLLDLFLCPAWVEDAAGRILARNTHSDGSAGILPANVAQTAKSAFDGILPAKRGRKVVRPAIAGRDARTPSQAVAYPLPPAGGTKGLRLVALFPAGRETDCQRRVITALLARMFLAGQAAAIDEALLTPRQREIFHELSQGYTYKEVADHLGISHNNVKVQINRMRKILGVEHIPLRRRKRWQILTAKDAKGAKK